MNSTTSEMPSQMACMRHARSVMALGTSSWPAE
jgi:hypothetical protein